VSSEPPAEGPTIEDAVALVTDPAYRAGGGVEGGFVRMQPAIITRLQEMGTDEQQARRLAHEAVIRVGGMDKSRNSQRPGLRAGAPPRYQWVDDFRVPQAKLRKP
jgi:hypothetical protein